VLRPYLPRIDLIESTVNLGFAGGSNLGIGRLDGVDHVALINSDAFVDPGWLAPLVEAIGDGTSVGAANARIVFEPRFIEVELRTEGFVPSTNDSRLLGVKVSGVRHGGLDGWGSVRYPRGFYFAESGLDPNEPDFRWSSPDGLLFVPVGDGSSRLALRLASEREKKVTLSCDGHSEEILVANFPGWYEVDLDGPRFDVVNNVGSILVTGGRGADRGFGERDEGQYDAPAEVFAWCGAAVLLSARYLADVGRFDEDYFLYYEDLDLSWRARSRGWRHVYVPESKVRHLHAASTIEGSPLFDHFVQRNRLLTLVKNAPLDLVVRECAVYGAEVSRLVYSEMVVPRLTREKRATVLSSTRLRSAAAFVEHFPAALRERQRIDARRTVPKGQLLRWMDIG
jgi:GT2 family glycosyltransferase